MNTTVVAPPLAPDFVGVGATTLTVHVDEEDILLGARRNQRECAVARAVRRTLALTNDDYPEVLVGSDHQPFGTIVWIIDANGHETFYRFQPNGWIELFDGGCQVKPATFTLVLGDS